MADNFPKLIDRVLGHEGGYVNDPRDPGGETKWGISKRSYPHLDIKNLTREGAIAIYRRDFWDKAKLGQFTLAAAYQFLDGAVNSGIGQASRWLQRSVGVADDGVIGPATLAAMKATDNNDILLRFLGQRLMFMTDLKNWPAHGRGWARRIARLLLDAAEDN